jgi:hypothetical protein
MDWTQLVGPGMGLLATVLAIIFKLDSNQKIALQKAATIAATDAAQAIGDTHAQLIQQLPGMLKDAANAALAIPGQTLTVPGAAAGK